VSIQLRRAPTDEEIETICTAAEEAARNFVLSKVSLKKLDDLSLSIEAVGDKPLSLSVELAVELDSDNPQISRIIDEATDAAFSAAEEKVRELGLCEASND
jgi:hypothetical protein